MKGSDRSPLGVITIGIVALFLAGFFLLVVFGASSYRNTVQGQNDNAGTRALLSYFSTMIKADDSGQVAFTSLSAEEAREAMGEKAPAGGTCVLSVVDPETQYGFFIYLYDVKLLEEYKAAEYGFHPDNAQEIGTTSSFVIEPVPLPFDANSRALRITTDAGSILVNFRAQNSSVEGGF